MHAMINGTDHMDDDLGVRQETHQEVANAKRDEKRCQEKGAICASFIELQMRALEVKESNARSKANEVEAKFLAEENRIILAELSFMDPANRALL
jgi:hypothetical protein